MTHSIQELNRRCVICFQGLVKKMYREFMIMGFISFAILLATELSGFTTDIWCGRTANTQRCVCDLSFLFALSYLQV
jgi:hypothetical protein